MAIDKEPESHQQQDTWSEVKLSEEKRTIKDKWIFRKKEDDTKKVRSVAKGFQIKEDKF